MGGVSYFILENFGNILVDSPAWDTENQEFLQEKGGITWLFLTHRGAIGKAKEIQKATGCKILIQEQEAYLLPGLELTTFQHEFTLSPTSQAIWTCGHSPGSACLYHSHHGGILFTGQHLLPDQTGEPTPLRLCKTFHWPRQIESVRQLRDRLSPATLNHLCPGASTGFLRGRQTIDRAYERLAQLDLEVLLQSQPGL